MSTEKDAFERWMPIVLIVAGVTLLAFGGYEAIVLAGVFLH